MTSFHFSRRKILGSVLNGRYAVIELEAGLRITGHICRGSTIISDELITRDLPSSFKMRAARGAHDRRSQPVKLVRNQHDEEEKTDLR